MDRRSNARVAADNLSAQILASDVDKADVAKATGLTIPELDSRLAGVQEFTFRDLVRAGGLLLVPAHSFMEGTR
jgi:hypothetical protein